MTLKDAQVGFTVKVVKIRRRRRIQTPHHGYGHHEGSEIFIRKVARWATR